MKLIFLIAMVALASAAEKKDESQPVQLVNPEHPDEKTVTFYCADKIKVEAYCGRRMEENKKLFQIKRAHTPAEARTAGSNCEGMNATINYCCAFGWTPTPKTLTRKRFSKRAKSTPDESTIFDNIPEDELSTNCDIHPAIGTETRR